MYLNVQIIQCVLFYFCFVDSFRNSMVVNNIYWNTLETRDGSLIGRKYSTHDRFNDMLELQWIAICKYVTKELRKNEGYVDVYVDYRATSKYTGERCNEILVWVPRISENVKQMACHCFLRPSILALDIPHEYNQYNRKIMIYPINVRTLTVFEENKDQGNFYPLEIYANKHWTDYNPVDVEISSTPLPQSYGEVSNLKTILDPIFDNLEFHSRKQQNILRRWDGLISLCKIVFERTRYFRMNIFYFNRHVTKKRQNVIVVHRTGNSEPKVTTTRAYNCSEFIPNTETIIMNYKIAPGPKQNSALVLRETSCPREVIYNKFYSHISKSDFDTSELICYEIVELIEYLSDQYVGIYY